MKYKIYLIKRDNKYLNFELNDYTSKIKSAKFWYKKAHAKQFANEKEKIVKGTLTYKVEEDK